MKTYFVTGSTGVLGSAVVEALLKDPSSRLRLLIRAPSQDVLQSRLRELLTYCAVDANAISDRVTPLAGDATQPRFGMPEEIYRDVVQECTHAIHCAGAVRMNLPIEEARRSAVGSARNLLRFAEDVSKVSGTAPKIEFVSTVGVGGRFPGSVPERWIDESRSFHNTYEQAKAEAEEVVKGAIDDGMPVTVHRPSMIVGSSTSGKVFNFQVFYHLAEFLSGRRTFGLFPQLGSATLDLVASNRVADAIVWSSTSPIATGRILHLCAGPGGAIDLPSLREIVRTAYRRHGLDVPNIHDLPTVIFRALTVMVGFVSDRRTRRALSTLPVFLDYLSDGQTFDNARTRELLSGAGLDLDRSDVLVEPILDFYLDAKHSGDPASRRR
ncbi:MAG: SDR family oxidoreductase [Vicinamibacterales bacterium]